MWAWYIARIDKGSKQKFSIAAYRIGHTPLRSRTVGPYWTKEEAQEMIEKWRR